MSDVGALVAGIAAVAGAVLFYRAARAAARAEADRKEAAGRRRVEFEARMSAAGDGRNNPQDWHERKAHVSQRDGGRCVRCGGRAALHVHHKVPRSVSRDHSAANLELLCVYCHSAEHGRDLVAGSVATKLAKHRRRFGKSAYVERKARKDHSCDRCKTPILRGATYYSGYWNAKYCERCFLSL